MRLHVFICWIFIFCTSSSIAHAQEEGVWNISLDSIIVTAHKNTPVLKTTSDGKISWNLQQMKKLPNLLGNVDPIRYAQMLPSIQTNNEFSTGLHIQGCDNQHNVVSISDVPIYNINHLLGFFSSFISSHYLVMDIDKSPSSVRMGNRLGGELALSLPDSIPQTVNGEISVGLISSQGTIRLPAGRNTAITLSLRASYMNLLYGHWLRSDDHQLRYSFYDANLTILHHIDSSNTIILDSYTGEDQGKFFDNSYLAAMNAKWGNRMASLHWIHQNSRGVRAKNTLFLTQYHNVFNLSLPDMIFHLPSDILDIGYHGHIGWNKWMGGVDAVVHLISPQSLNREGSYNETLGRMPIERPVECSLFGEYYLPLAPFITLTAGLRANLFHREEYFHMGLDPFIKFSYDNSGTQLSFTIARKHQYLFQTGFSDIGLPTEFWMSANNNLIPQTTNTVNITFTHDLLNRRYRLSADLFYKKLGNQIDYSGSVLDLANTVYDINQCLLHGKGQNYGFSILINKCTGALTGWLGYSYTNASRRMFKDGQNSVFPASHSRPHELNAVITYSHKSHWDFGASMVCASGTPFTAAESLSVLNGNILIRYADHNEKRLRPYFRVDVSINYKWKNRAFRENGFNFSIYNVTNHRNELFYYLKSHLNGEFAYRPVTSILLLLPSLSYYCNF